MGYTGVATFNGVPGVPFAQLPEDEVLKEARQALEAALHYEIIDFDHQGQWVHLRFVSRLRFWNEEVFRYFLDDPLFRPEAKLRNLLVSYGLASRATKEL